MPRYYFDIKDGHRLVDPKGIDCRDDAEAIARGEVVAIGVSLDKPAVDPLRHIAVKNEAGQEISECRFILNQRKRNRANAERNSPISKQFYKVFISEQRQPNGI
jgi:hypothetical protein